MNLSDIRFPRELEADDHAEAIRQALMARTVKIWPGGHLDVSMITMSDPLKKALQKARLKGRIRCGYEAILDKLESERKGITNVRERQGAPYGDRVSRLLLFSSDGAERLYRHIEHLLLTHAPRLLGCLLDIDGSTLGNIIAGEDRKIKIVMVEHKEAVSDILRTIIASQV
jgi:hypothetical protein